MDEVYFMELPLPWTNSGCAIKFYSCKAYAHQKKWPKIVGRREARVPLTYFSINTSLHHVVYRWNFSTNIHTEEMYCMRSYFNYIKKISDIIKDSFKMSNILPITLCNRLDEVV